ncbi:sialate:O-sulfotransferase 2-like [Tubulanus polymorphus]|uniref:sialate:O-sulfotransferase 2-like n=1 Tax=Tubulanus polymorphus TaxID=672921 RepID=UPI003DA2B6CB
MGCLWVTTETKRYKDVEMSYLLTLGAVLLMMASYVTSRSEPVRTRVPELLCTTTTPANDDNGNMTSGCRTYVGCFEDRKIRDLTTYAANSDKSMTIGKCIGICKKKEFMFAGLQYSAECFCGNRVGKYGPVPKSQCRMKCAGNPKEICGSPWRNSVYATSDY